MTEQEKREKAIAKMIKASDCDGLFDEVPEEVLCRCVRNGGYRDIANIYDASYRKADEVEKETARKIIKYLRENGQFSFDYPDDPAQNVLFDESIFEKLEDMFGVEVEE